MSQLKTTFIELINQGTKAIALISDGEKKANACAALASAIAQSGLLVPMITAEAAEPLQEKQGTIAGKEALKTSAGKKNTSRAKKEVATDQKVEAPVEEVAEQPVEATQEPVQEVAAEETYTEEDATWTEENTAAQQENVDALAYYVESWGEDYVYNTCLNNFMERNDLKADDFWSMITPLNIAGFVSYLYMIYEQSQQ